MGYHTSAYAYLDPGTGSIILQGLLAAVAGIIVAGKLYWARIKSFFPSIFSRRSTQEQHSERGKARNDGQ